MSHNRIAALPPKMRMPSGSPYWGNKIKRPREKDKAASGRRGSTNATTPASGGAGLVTVGSDVPASSAPYVPPSAPELAGRTQRYALQMPRGMQPFRMYAHGNAGLELPPHLMARLPDAMGEEGEVPAALHKNPRGSGAFTTESYDGCVWPSEAALHAALQSPTVGPASIGVAEMQGRKLRMEDAVVVRYCFRGRVGETFVAVFDGHAGSSDVAEEGAAELADEVARQLASGGGGGSDADVTAAMQRAFLQVNDRMLARPSLPVGGAVAVALLLQLTGPRTGVLHCANVGDARAVLVRDGQALRISRDFKPTDDDEYARVRDLGGWVSLRSGGRVCDVLCPSRSLGDVHLAEFIVPLAHVHSEQVEL